MTSALHEARLATQKAREALSRGDRRQARQYAERAAKLAPQLEDPWLVLAAVAGPARLEYIQKAPQINPTARACKGKWVMHHLRQPDVPVGNTQETPAVRRQHAEDGTAAPRLRLQRR
jgi:hypothetical protein